MDILEKRIRITELIEFEKLLKKLYDIDISIIGKIKEVEEKSFIITHKFLFIPKLEEIDFSKIGKDELRKIVNLLKKLSEFETILTGKLHTFEIFDLKNSKFKNEDKRLIKYIKNYLTKLFKSIEETQVLLLLLYDAIKKEDEEELESFFSELIDELYKIKKFCSELEHYAEFWKTNVEKTPYIDALKVKKSKEYEDFFHKNPHLRKKVNDVEKRIEKCTEYNKNFHKILRNVKVKGCPGVNHPMRARIDKNLRIIYIWDSKNKRMKFIKIGTHQEIQDKLKIIKWTW